MLFVSERVRLGKLCCSTCPQGRAVCLWQIYLYVVVNHEEEIQSLDLTQSKPTNSQEKGEGSFKGPSQDVQQCVSQSSNAMRVPEVL